MSHTNTAETATDWEALAEALAPVPCESGRAKLKRKSRDYYWFSPILSKQLGDIGADLIAMPENEAQLAHIIKVCHDRRIPLTPRGAGTGNYGQAMPLAGGVVLDLSHLAAIDLPSPGVMRAGAGAKLFAMDGVARAAGWQLRLYPSTWRLATIGGFLAGGSSGCGALNWGTIHSPGNVLALRVMTMEAEPRIITLEGADVQKVLHAYGMTGVILDATIALAPAVEWAERVIGMPGDFAATSRLGEALCRTTGLHLNEVAVIAASGAAYFRALEPWLEPHENILIVLVAANSATALDRYVSEQGAQIRFAREPGAAEPAKVPPLLEYCWNHTTLQALAHDKSVTYLQTLFPHPDPQARVAQVISRLGDELPMHVEFVRTDGDLTLIALPLLRFTSAERLTEIEGILREEGCVLFNPHTVMLETGGLQVADPVQFTFKQEADPLGLLNPGKMPGWPETVILPAL